MEQTRSGAGSSKLATCRHFNLLSSLHSTLTSQGTDSNVDIGFYENQNDIESSNEIREDSQIATNSRSTIANTTEHVKPKIKGKEKVRVSLMFNSENHLIMWMMLLRPSLKIKVYRMKEQWPWFRYAVFQEFSRFFTKSNSKENKNSSHENPESFFSK